MFKFNFPSYNSDQTDLKAESEDIETRGKSSSQEVDGREIEIQTHHHESVNQYRENSSSTTLVREFHLVDVKHVEQLIVSREIEKFKPLRIALEMNSDVISGVYEGKCCQFM